MAELLATMPVMPLTFGCMVKFEAIGVDSGAAVAGVTVSTAVIYAIDMSDGATAVETGPFMLVPGPGAGGGTVGGEIV